jgi:hypothetical protein
MLQNLRAAYVASSSTTAQLAPGKFKEKLADTQGGHPTFVSRSLIHSSAYSFPDTTRGVLNEGGLFGERAGWHLPGFDTSSWVERDLSAGLPNGAVGIGFFVTTFPLDIPDRVAQELEGLECRSGIDVVGPAEACVEEEAEVPDCVLGRHPVVSLEGVVREVGVGEDRSFPHALFIQLNHADWHRRASDVLIHQKVQTWTVGRNGRRK